ncbi:MAG: DMT family transporter [Alphaproteobacteria bacterium]
MARDPAYRRGVVCCAAAGMLASFNGILFRGVEHASDWQVVFWRSGTMALALLVLLAVRKRGHIATAFRAAGWPAVVAGLTLGTSNFTFSLAMIHTTVANALFINAGAPFIAAVLSWLLLKESIAMATVLAMTTAFAGVGVMVVDGLAGGELFGNAMAVAAALTYGCFAVALRIRRGADMLPAVVIAGTFSAAVALVAQQGDVLISWHDSAMSIGMGLFTMSTSFALFTAGARHVAAAPAILLAEMEVVFGPLWVLLLFGEVPSMLSLVGGALVLAAITGHALWSMRHGGSSPEPAPPPLMD